MTQWISVKIEEPPRKPILTTNGHVIHVAYPNDDLDEPRWQTGAGLISCHYCGGTPPCHFKKHLYKDYIFTHWAELPELPND